MKHIYTIVLLSLFLMPAATAIAQEETGQPESKESPRPGERVREHHKHSLSVLLSHVHILDGIEGGSIRGIQRPSWMVAYNYSLNERWALGVHGDIILETFSVEPASSESEEELLEREYPISLVGAASFKVIDHLAVQLGGGLEFDKSESFGLVRIGLEPFLRLSSRIELILNLSYDIKFNAYDNWNLGFGIAYGL
jgi:hypothetical protein